jgi:1-acyl-sn-glycerol-3-phosphate acyltransferase
MKNVSRFWRLSFFLNFFFTLLLFFPVFKLLFSHPSLYPAALRLQRAWAFWLLFCAGIRMKIADDGRNSSGPYIYCPNHTSALDILLMYAIVPESFHFVAKKEHAEAPLFGVMFGKTHIPLQRDSKVDSFKAMKRAEEDLKKGISIVIFPEGTMNYDEGSLKPFRNGAFKLAVDTGVPIVPVVFYDNLRLLPHTYRILYPAGGPGTSKISVGNPVNPLAFEGSSQLMKTVRQQMENQLTAGKH